MSMSLAILLNRTIDTSRWLVGAVLITLAISVCPNLGVAKESKLKVVTSIKPIHSLVAGVMNGVGKPQLLLTGTSTPHGFSLKPSQSVTLQDADVIFWVGPTLEASLKKPIGTIGAGALSIELEHVIGEDGHEAQRHHEKHEAEKEAGHGEHHRDHLGERGHAPNAHLWLNPDNAILMVHKIADVLGKADPKNRNVFFQNSQSTILKIRDLNKHLEETLEPIKKNEYILFHDAYRSFEERFSFSSAGIISVNPEARLSAARIVELQKIVGQQNVSCVFSEPQFNANTTALIVEGSGAKIGVLDPLGSRINDGPDHYFTLMTNIANNFVNCLSN